MSLVECYVFRLFFNFLIFVTNVLLRFFNLKIFVVLFDNVLLIAVISNLCVILVSFSFCWSSLICCWSWPRSLLLDFLMFCGLAPIRHLCPWWAYFDTLFIFPIRYRFHMVICHHFLTFLSGLLSFDCELLNKIFLYPCKITFSRYLF